MRARWAQKMNNDDEGNNEKSKDSDKNKNKKIEGSFRVMVRTVAAKMVTQSRTNRRSIIISTSLVVSLLLSLFFYRLTLIVDHTLLLQSTSHDKNTNICGKVIHPHPSTITTPHAPLPRRCEKSRVILFGNRTAFGRTNNNLISLFHILDDSWENGNYIIATTGWVDTLIRSLFDMPFIASSSLCLISHGDLRGEDAATTTVEISPSSRRLYFRWSTIDVTPARLAMMRSLFSHPHPRLCDEVGRAVSSLASSRYAVIHVRSMEGACHRLLSEMVSLMEGRMTPNDSCEMTPVYVKSILRPLGMLNGDNSTAIFIVSDGTIKSREIVRRLRDDEEMGGLVTERSGGGDMEADMMLAVLSDVFIGTAVSTMSGNIARARIALGFDPLTNYVYVREDKSRTTTRFEGETVWISCGIDCHFGRIAEIPHRGGPPKYWKKKPPYPTNETTWGVIEVR